MKITDQKERLVHAPLAEVVGIQPGYLSRSGVRNAPDGTHYLIQAKDVSPESGVCLDEAIRFHPRRKTDRYGISAGDILLAARGQDHRAYLISETFRNVLASSVFYILRPGNRVRSAYLAWWLNLPEAQTQIEAGSQGTDIGYLPRQTLEKLSVAVPDLETQALVEKAVSLWQREKALQDRLNEKREQLIYTVCQQAVGHSQG